MKRARWIKTTIVGWNGESNYNSGLVMVTTYASTRASEAQPSCSGCSSCIDGKGYYSQGSSLERERQNYSGQRPVFISLRDSRYMI